MTKKKIEADIHDEFLLIRKELKIHLTTDFDIKQQKEFLEKHIPQEVIYKSEILLDTVLNYLMDKARNELKNSEVKLQNKFFEADFRKRIHDWYEQLENKLKLEPDIVKYSIDPRLKRGLIAGGITFVVGSIITATVFIPTMAVGAIVSGLVTILVSALIFKIVYDKSAPKSREVIKDDIDKYLNSAESQVYEWLKSVINTFLIDFNEFCAVNGFKQNGETK